MQQETTRLEDIDRQLHTAAFAGDVELCKKLCKANADFNSREPNQGGLTALHLAATSSAQKPAVRVIEYLCKVKGAHVDACGDGGQTPLHWACEKGHGLAVEMLCRCGARLNLVTKSGSTALHIAARRSHLEVVKVLLAEAHGDFVNDKRPAYASMIVQNEEACCLPTSLLATLCWGA